MLLLLVGQNIRPGNDKRDPSCNAAFFAVLKMRNQCEAGGKRQCGRDIIPRGVRHALTGSPQPDRHDPVQDHFGEGQCDRNRKHRRLSRYTRA